MAVAELDRLTGDSTVGVSRPVHRPAAPAILPDRMRKTAGTVCLILVGSAVALAVSVLCFVDYEMGQAAAVLLGAFIGIAVLCCPQRCHVCRVRIRRGAHRCVVDGACVRVCPGCHSRIEGEQAKHLLHRLSGE